MTTLPRLVLALALAIAPAAARAQDTALAHPLTLGDAARLAARRNSQAEEARDRADAATARITQRRSELLPQFSASAQESGSTINTNTFPFDLSRFGFDPNGTVIGPVNALDVRAQFAMSLVNIASYDRVSAAKSAAGASAADAANIGDLAGELAARTYVRLQRAEALVAARLADSVLADSLLGIARQQLKSGVGVAIDVTRARVQASTIRAQLIFQRADRDRSRLELQRVLNLPLETKVTLADSLEPPAGSAPLPSESAAVALAMRARADLRAAALQVDAAKTSVSAIKSERLPSLGVAANYGVIGQNGMSYLPTYNWGVAVSIPIFDGLRRESRIEEQKAGVREAVSHQSALVRQASIEVRSALVDLSAAAEQMEAARERLDLSQLEVTQARDRFVAGVAGNLDVIQASSNLNTARSQLVEALAAYQYSRVTLARAEGTITRLP
jgi:outer membrane protein TolC